MNRSILIGLFFVVFTTSCITYEDVDIQEIEDVKVENLFSLSKPTRLILKIKIHNPNNYNIKIKDADLNLFVGKKDLGKMSLEETVLLKKKTEEVQTIVFLPISKNLFKDAMKGAAEVLLTGKVKIRVKGKIKGKAFGVGKWFDVDHKESIDISSKKFFEPEDFELITE